MSYQVLARKWRPGNFEQLVGQSQTAKALSNALESGRLHHAYLFTGTRGVGKTTIARILAKSLNCDKGITSNPCGECASCTEITQGNFVDLLEIDAASKTKVEDTRELLDNVQYRPTKGRYKVYLIDEVHMLSGHSFNALLKTLEEPPPHVIFLLATTDPQKMPVTVLSRCLQFHLRRMDELEITNHLSMILEQENIPFEPQALESIAKGADGSMRDALSLMDQAIAFCGEKIETEQVVDMLGTIDRAYAVKLLEAIQTGEAEQLIETINKIAEFAPDYDELISDWLTMLYQIAVAQAIDKSDDPQILKLANEISAADLQLFYQLSLQARKDLAFAPSPKQGFEMAMLRVMAFRPDNGASSAPSNANSGARTASREEGDTTVKKNSEASVSRFVDQVPENNQSAQESQVTQPEPALKPSSEFEVATKQEEKQGANPEQSIQLDFESRKISDANPSSRFPESEVYTRQINEPTQGSPLSKISELTPSGPSAAERVKAMMSQASAVDLTTKTNLVADVNADAIQIENDENLENISKTEVEIAEKAAVEKIELEAIKYENWYQVTDGVELDGNGLQVLLNALATFENETLRIIVQEKIEPLFTGNAKALIVDAIQKYFENDKLKMTFNIDADNAQIFIENETPKERLVRLHQLALDNAESKLLNDPQVGFLIENLGAILHKESIRLH